MKAAVHTDAYELTMSDWPDPQVQDPDHVLVKVGAVGFCGSDKHDLDHAPQRPQVPGHEIAGVIEAVGSEPGRYAVGDRILIMPRARCGKCEQCLSKPRGECQNWGVHGCRGSNHPPGGMAEFILVRTENLLPVPDSISLEEASLADPLAVAVYAVHCGPEVSGQRCVVMGAGVIGLLLAQVLEARGAASVTLVDILPSHLDVASRLGNYTTLLADDDTALRATLTELDAGIYYELAGGESPTLDIAVGCIRHGGHILLVSQRPKGVWLNYQRVMGMELTMRGVSGTSLPAWKEALDLMYSGRVDVKPVISHLYPLERATEALDMACHGDSLKVILQPNGRLA